MNSESFESASERYTSRFPGRNGGSETWLDKCSRITCPPGAALYREGQRCGGVFQVESGEIKLSVSSSSGKTGILKIVQPGELLGVTEAFADSAYLATAESIEPSEVLFIPRTHLQHLWSNKELAAQIITHLSRECSRMVKEVSAYRLASTAAQRLAQFLLELLDRGVRSGDVQVIEMPYTHAEIAQLIGCSRETVTRLFNRFQDARLIDIQSSAIRIEHTAKLREVAQL